MLGVTTIRSHSYYVGSQALGEDCHRLVHVFSWHLFPDGLQSDFQLISCLMLRLEFMILCQHSVPDVTVTWVQVWCFNEPGTVHSQLVLRNARTLRNCVHNVYIN